MRTYYNENDERAAAWLRELMAQGVIPDGEVDTRSIVDVQPDDLRGFGHCHFFAGIGGWAYALRLAGWPLDREVWTGSCPCQPWSAIGSGLGFDDDRHLWPPWLDLIRERRPATIFGEQTASPDGVEWIDVVLDDLVSVDYAAAAFDLPACSAGAPIRRQRLWFVADAYRDGLPIVETSRLHAEGQQRDNALRCGAHGDIANASRFVSPVVDLGRGRPAVGLTHGDWHEAEWLACIDGLSRPVESGVFPLAYGVSGRVGLLWGYGNAIVPQVAAEVIRAYLEFKE